MGLWKKFKNILKKRARGHGSGPQGAGDGQHGGGELDAQAQGRPARNFAERRGQPLARLNTAPTQAEQWTPAEQQWLVQERALHGIPPEGAGSSIPLGSPASPTSPIFATQNSPPESPIFDAGRSGRFVQNGAQHREGSSRGSEPPRGPELTGQRIPERTSGRTSPGHKGRT
jgi:hypothetical protein